MEWVRPFFGLAWGAIGWDRVYCEGMRDTDLFQLALGLQSPWTVTRSEFAVEDGRLDLYVDFPRGSRFACAECGREGCAVHDTKDETWRHLDFFQHRTLLHARVPRVICPKCGVRKVATPWARAGSGFTLLFEAYVLALAKAMPIANAAKRLGEHDTRLWRIVEHYVWGAVEALDLSQVRRIASDETSARRGHDYISLFVDMARRKVIYVADGKDAATVKEFADFLEAHGGKREAVTDASIDMGAAFEAGIKANFENAEITFDKFHVIKLANEAVDEVRRQAHLRQLEILTSCFTSTISAEKATWHYITFSDCISEFGGPIHRSFCGGMALAAHHSRLWAGARAQRR